MNALRQVLATDRIDALERSSARILAFGKALELLAPLGQLCVASDGWCLACGARQGEPCRQPRT